MDNQSFKSNINTGQAVAGVVLFAVLAIGGALVLKPNIALRLLIGIGFGYVLSRAFSGFAGSVNRACRTGSTQLMRTLAFMFFITSIIVAGFAYRDENFAQLDLWINPVNLGLCVGAAVFGFGMAISSCCASGVMQDVACASPRAVLTLIFFGIGVFVGFPLQYSQAWIEKSVISSERGAGKGGGFFFPDLFKWDGFNGFLGAILLTGVLCLALYKACMWYEKKQKESGRYTGVGTEALQASAYDYDISKAKFFSRDTYYHFIVKPFTLKEGAIGLTVLFTLLLALFKSEWGASTPYGLWVARVLIAFGVSPEKIAIFANTTMGGAFETPFLEQAVTMQDIGILFGAVIYMLLAGNWIATVKESLSITGKEAVMYCIGGFTMGFGTRMAQGCNAGALYSPIAAFSLSGWVFLPFMVIGGVLGNKVYKKTGIRA
ncbi:MAG: YeeE/YedE family protein [Lachnospiraceae bacterium]|nr:YeeE/YedE family protein [Lachnospiraceae bacterium]